MNTRSGCIKVLDHYYESDYLQNIARVTNSELRIFLLDEFYIPIFCKPGSFGTIINSSPFFGSHGGFRLHNNANFRDCVKKTFEEIIDFTVGSEIAAVTLVENPYASSEEIAINRKFQLALSNSIADPCMKTKRFSAVLHLDSITDEEHLIRTYHQKTRNCLRKFFKTGAQIKSISANAPEADYALEWIADEHIKGLKDKSGIYKPKSYFQNLREDFEAARFEVRLCSLEGEDVAGLINFRCGNETEYWTPVITKEGREINALYGLIHDSANDILGREGAILNFGGSWETQHDLLRFKQRFGAEIKEYKYRTYILNTDLLALSPLTLQADYPFFFVRPY